MRIFLFLFLLLQQSLSAQSVSPDEALAEHQRFLTTCLNEYNEGLNAIADTITQEYTEKVALKLEYGAPVCVSDFNVPGVSKVKFFEGVGQALTEQGSFLFHVLNNYHPCWQKSACVYHGALDAAVHVHPYGTNADETTFPHYTFKKKNEETYIVLTEVLDAWRGKPILLRPHAYIGHKSGIVAGGRWNQQVQARVAWADDAESLCNGAVHIHDHVASPAGVMQLGICENLLAKGPFVSQIISHHPVKTLHVLVPQHKQGVSIHQLETYGLVAFLHFLYPHEKIRSTQSMFFVV